MVDVPVYATIHPDDTEVTDEVLRLSRNLVGDGGDLYGYPIFCESFGEEADLARAGFRDSDIVIVDPSLVEEDRLVLIVYDNMVELRRLIWNAKPRLWDFRAVIHDGPTLCATEDQLVSTTILGTVVALWRTAG